MNEEWQIEVIVTENIPWADCKEKIDSNWENTWRFVCLVPKWSSSIINTWNIISTTIYVSNILAIIFFVLIIVSIFINAFRRKKLMNKISISMTIFVMVIILLDISFSLLPIITPWIYK